MFIRITSTTLVLLFVVIMLPGSAASAATRIWTDDTGKFKVQADFVEIHEGNVRLRKKDDSIIEVPILRLSRSDIAHLKRKSYAISQEITQIQNQSRKTSIATSAIDQSRTWSDSTGEHKIAATFVREVNGRVTLKKDDGRTISVSMDTLSEPDQSYIQRQKAQLARPRGPWSITEVSKSTIAPSGGGSFTMSLGSGGERYLYVYLQSGTSTLQDSKLRKFRVENSAGKTVGELYGWKGGARSLLIFQGSWQSLSGLYLTDGHHREPLVKSAGLLDSLLGK